ncbi:hypothetical protein JNUCC76_05470 [Leuconostoc sp. JNUCC 76]
MFISNVSVLAIWPHHWHHPVFEYPICWPYDFILVLLFATYYFDKPGYCFWHQKRLSDAGLNYYHYVNCISTVDILAASSQFIAK